MKFTKFVKSVAYFCTNCTPLDFRYQGTIYELHVGHFEFKIADTNCQKKLCNLPGGRGNLNITDSCAVQILDGFIDFSKPISVWKYERVIIKAKFHSIFCLQSQISPP